MSQPISLEAVEQIFTAARSHHAWTDRPVSADELKSLYEIMKWGPTSVNSGPARLVFVQSDAGKEKLYPALMEANVAQVRAAPVTAIVAFDERFFDHVKDLFPAYDATALFAGDRKLRQETAFRNSSMQGAYLIIAARALGLDACPMSGFDNAKVDEAFFQNGTWRSNFICTLGHGDGTKLWPRGPRLAFEDVCRVV
ncbi:MAG: malonic semialdehyde reductase [Xanthobacteraceae bacterium]|nr:malonic semialdehyde reductase [Xanthobacteraceae bacterium]